MAGGPGAEPILRATTETGAVWDDPSEDVLHELLLDIDRGDEQFFVLERLADPSGHTYAQVIRDGDAWHVERRDGGPEAHFATRVADLGAAHAVLVDWAFGPLPGAEPPPVTWERLQL